MKHLLKGARLIVIILIVTGCATPGTYFALNPENDGEATVHFFRNANSVRPYAFAIEIFVDGQVAASLSSSAVVAFSVPVGDRSLLLKWQPGSLTHGKLEAKLNFKGRESRYFLVSERPLSGPSIAFLFVGDRLRLFEVSAEYAQQLRQIIQQN